MWIDSPATPTRLASSILRNQKPLLVPRAFRRRTQRSPDHGPGVRQATCHYACAPTLPRVFTPYRTDHHRQPLFIPFEHRISLLRNGLREFAALDAANPSTPKLQFFTFPLTA